MKLENLDPSKDKRYHQWLLAQVTNGHITIKDNRIEAHYIHNDQYPGTPENWTKIDTQNGHKRPINDRSIYGSLSNYHRFHKQYNYPPIASLNLSDLIAIISWEVGEDWNNKPRTVHINEDIEVYAVEYMRHPHWTGKDDPTKYQQPEMAHFRVYASSVEDHNINHEIWVKVNMNTMNFDIMMWDELSDKIKDDIRYNVMHSNAMKCAERVKNNPGIPVGAEYD